MKALIDYLNSHKIFDFKFNLINSYRYEKDKLPSDETVEKLHLYLTEHNIPDLNDVYQIMFNTDLIRNDDVFVGSATKFSTMYSATTEIAHIGLHHTLIDYDMLQGLVNEIYGLDNSIESVVKAFKYYIQYEIIHPSFDGNGRIGRLIFIEWKFKLSFSSALFHLNLNQDILFKPFQIHVLYQFDVPLNSYEADKNKNIKQYYILKYKDNLLNDNLYLKWIYIILVYECLYDINHGYIGSIKKILKTKYEDLDKVNIKYPLEVVCKLIDKEEHNRFVLGLN
jgi:hypothetical protein